jgi:hypothetical protein
LTTETDDQPASAGVAAEATAPTDDLSTEQFDRVEAPEDEDDAAPADTGEGDDDSSDADKAKTAAEREDLEEIELSDGSKVKVPKEVALERLRHQDYTKKTQEAAEVRRALEADRSTWETEREASRAALPEEHKAVAVLSHSISVAEASVAQFDNIDWTAFRTQALTEGGEKADLYNDYRARFNAARDTLTDLKDELGRATNDLKTKEDARLTAQRETATAELAKRQEETGKALAREIEGWSPEKAINVIKFAETQYGVTPAEMAEATDARLWKALHDNLSKDEKISKLEAALKQAQTANGNLKAQESKPAETAKGGGAANARDPATPRGDGLSTAEWMRRRNGQKAKA